MAWAHPRLVAAVAAPEGHMTRDPNRMQGLACCVRWVKVMLMAESGCARQGSFEYA